MTVYPQSEIQELARLRAVFFCGLPATGKSLFVRDLAEFAHAQGRHVFCLQWDVARPALEASKAAARYPAVDGITHALLRRAAGLWARDAVGRWHGTAPPQALLIGETPLIGGRFIELVRPQDDTAESLLGSEGCRFVLLSPSQAVRRGMEAERERRSVAPLNLRELEDAPLHAMGEHWHELVEVGRRLGIPVPPEAAERYEASFYTQVYLHLLWQRRVTVLPVTNLNDDIGLRSVYDLACPVTYLQPEDDEARDFIRLAEAEAEEGGPGPWWQGAAVAGA